MGFFGKKFWVFGVVGMVVSFSGTPAFATLEALIQDYDALEKVQKRECVEGSISKKSLFIDKNASGGDLCGALEQFLKYCEIPPASWNLYWNYPKLRSLALELDRANLPIRQLIGKLNRCELGAQTLPTGGRYAHMQYISHALVESTPLLITLKLVGVDLERIADQMRIAINEELALQRVRIADFAEKHPNQVTDSIRFRLEEINATDDLGEFKKAHEDLVDQYHSLEAEVANRKKEVEDKQKECAALDGVLEEKRKQACEEQKKHAETMQVAELKLQAILQSIDNRVELEKLKLDALQRKYTEEAKLQNPEDSIVATAMIADALWTGSVRREIELDYLVRDKIKHQLKQELKNELTSLLLNQKLIYENRYSTDRRALTIQAKITLIEVGHRKAYGLFNKGLVGKVRITLENSSSSYESLSIRIEFDESWNLETERFFTEAQKESLFRFLDTLSAQEKNAGQVRNGVRDSMRRHFDRDSNKEEVSFSRPAYPSLSHYPADATAADEVSYTNLSQPGLSLRVPLLQGRGEQKNNDLPSVSSRPNINSVEMSLVE